MSEFVEILSPKAKQELEQANAELVKMLANMKNVNAVTIGAKTPSGSDSALKSLTAEYEKQQKVIQSLQNQLTKLAEKQTQNNQTTKKQVQAILDQSKSYQGLAKQKEQSIKQSQREAIALEKANNVYNKVQTKVNQLSATYNNIAIKKELGLKLTEKEVAQLTSLENRLNKYQSALKKVDSNIQKYGRNVGNYSSGWNGLSNSINQITRELPAFTYSAQTGFLALSNNIPILTDEIGRLVTANKELISQGKPVKSVFSQVLSSLLSWQTAMGVGILMFTVYGKEIGEFVSNLFKTKKAISESEEQAKRYNSTMSNVNANLSKIASDELSRSKLLFETAKNTNLTYTQRIKAVDELQKRYPDYLGNLTKEQILAGETAEAETLLAQALIKRSTAMASMDMIEENVRKRLEAQKKLALELNEVERLRLEWGKKRVRVVGDLEKETEANKERDEILRQTYATEGLANIRYKEKIKLLDEEEKILLSLFNENSKYLDIVKTSAETSKEASIEKIEAIKTESASVQSFLKLLRERLRIEKELLSVTTDSTSRKTVEENIKTLEEGIKLIEEPLSGLEKTGKKVAETLSKIFTKPENAEELSNFIKDFRQSFIDEFSQNSGFDKFLFLFSDEFDKIKDDATSVALAITEAFQQMYNTINEMSNARYEREFERLEQQKEISLLFAGESATAREEIERQYDEKRKQIERQRARQQKELAIFNATINTAQAVTSALANYDYTSAILFGILGAVQIALISSQQIPQFYKGTDNAPEGWAWTQERGAEIITDKHGKIKSMGSDKGAQLTYLNKGDKVFDAKETQEIMFNNELNGILMNNGISNASTIVNNNVDLSPLRSDIQALERTIKNKPEWSLIRDVQGERLYQKEQGMKKLLVSNRLRIKG